MTIYGGHAWAIFHFQHDAKAHACFLSGWWRGKNENIMSVSICGSVQRRHMTSYCCCCFSWLESRGAHTGRHVGHHRSVVVPRCREDLPGRQWRRRWRRRWRNRWTRTTIHKGIVMIRSPCAYTHGVYVNAFCFIVFQAFNRFCCFFNNSKSVVLKVNRSVSIYRLPLVKNPASNCIKMLIYSTELQFQAPLSIW